MLTDEDQKLLDREAALGFDCPSLAQGLARCVRRLDAELSAVTQERDWLKDATAKELQENFRLFELVGLTTPESFGNNDATTAIAEKYKAMQSELSAARAEGEEIKRLAAEVVRGFNSESNEDVTVLEAIDRLEAELRPQKEPA